MWKNFTREAIEAGLPHFLESSLHVWQDHSTLSAWKKCLGILALLYHVPVPPEFGIAMVLTALELLSALANPHILWLYHEIFGFLILFLDGNIDLALFWASLDLAVVLVGR